MPDISARLAYCRAIIKWPFAICATFFTLLTGAASIRDEFLSPNLQQRLKMPQWLPSLPWYWWAIIALSIIILGIFEGSFRFYRQTLGVVSFFKPIVTDVYIISNIEPLTIIFNCVRDMSRLRIILEYSVFVNGQCWTKPRVLPIEELNHTIAGKRLDLPLTYREDSNNPQSGLHWGAPPKLGEIPRDLISFGLNRGRIRFIGDRSKEKQNYYFMAMISRDDNKTRIEVIPHHDFSFINDWELGKI